MKTMHYYYPPGMPKTLDYVDAAVPELLLSSAATHSDRVAVVDGDQTLTYQELLTSAQTVAADLRSFGIGPGDTVGLHLPNCLHFFTAYYGALLTGAAITPINPLQPPAALQRQLVDASATAVISHVNYLGALAETTVTEHLKRVLVVQDHETTTDVPSDQELSVDWLEDVIAHPVADFEPVLASPDDVVHRAFTGGTTGNPKGVRVLHRNIIANATQMLAWRFGSLVERSPDGSLHVVPSPTRSDNPIVPGEAATIQVPPLFHAQGLVNCASFVLAGITIVLQRRFNPEQFFEDVQHWGVQYISGNPPMYLALAEHGRKTGAVLPSVRVAVSGAAPMTEAAVAKIRPVLPNARIVEGYGLTEASCLVTATPVTEGSTTKLGSVGLPVSDTTIEIRSLDGKTVLTDDVEGELWVSGPQVTDGYSNASYETSEQYVDGWLRTGDVALRDADGFIWIRDRAKDMLTYKGYNVYPKELEQVVAEHPAVAQVSVVGREHADVGELPVAFVVLAEGHEPEAQQILDFVADRVLPYQKVRELHLVDALPTSTAGKILKREVRRLLDDSQPLNS